MAVELKINQPLPPEADRLLLEKAGQLVFKWSKSSTGGVIALSFADKPTMRALNREHTGHDYATDVLSFDYREEGLLPKQEYVGEIVICSAVAAQQAAEYGLSPEAEMCLLLIHGLLHLSGYDHQDEPSQAGFSTIQDAIMEELALKTRQFQWLH